MSELNNCLTLPTGESLMLNFGSMIFQPLDATPKVDHIIYNGPATIVFWKDGTKTVVKVAEDGEFNVYWGFCAALAEKVFGSNHAVKSIIRRNCNLALDKQLKLKDEAKSK